jgi:hypothetical protein
MIKIDMLIDMIGNDMIGDDMMKNDMTENDTTKNDLMNKIFIGVHEQYIIIYDLIKTVVIKTHDENII